jgi:hypothetical protein
MLNKEKGIYLKSSELEYVRNCLSADIEYRKNNNYYPDVDNILNKIGNRIIKRLNNQMSNNFEIWFKKEVLNRKEVNK